MSTGIVKSEKFSPNSVEVFWTIGKLGKKLEEKDFLRSVPFYFAGQMWTLELRTVGRFQKEFCFAMYFSISRITVSMDETPDSHVVCWNMGILDSYWRYHYGSIGCASMAMVSKWVTVADFDGPEYKDLCLQKDLYMPSDEITIAAHLVLDSSHALMKVEEDSPTIIQEISIDVVVINVKGKTFYAEGSILDGIPNDIELKISEWTRGRMTVIDLPDCDPKAFAWFLSFRSKEVEQLFFDVSREVYYIADKFQIPELKRECVQCYLRVLCISYVCEFLEIAERYHDRELKEKCSKFFLKNAREILNTSEWLEFMAKRTKFANELIISYLDSIAG